MAKYYVTCASCNGRAYRMQGKEHTFWCPKCELNFTSEEEPKLEGEESEMKKCKCPKCKTENEWDNKKKGYSCGKCGKIYRGPRSDKGKEKTSKVEKLAKKVIKKHDKAVPKNDINIGCELCDYKVACKLFGKIPPEICKWYKMCSD